MTVFTLSGLHFAVKYNSCGWRIKVELHSGMSDADMIAAILAEFAGYEWMVELWLEFEQAATLLIKEKGEWLRGELKGYKSKQISVYKTDSRAQS
jgi:hypothetical protein